MTYEQVEKSFMESKPMKFLTDLHSQMITTRGYPQWEGETVQDVLKQSFIKYLQSEVEVMCKRQKNFDRKAILLQKKNNRTVREDMLFTRWTSHASELEHQITHITNQIKELEI